MIIFITCTTLLLVMTQQNLLELAKQGEPKAIALLMNRSLQPKGITVQATLSGNCLLVIAESKKAPEQSFIVDFTYSSITDLNVEVIKRVVIRGQAIGNKNPVWRKALDLDSGAKIKQVQTSLPVNQQASDLKKILKAQAEVLNEAFNFVKETHNTKRAILVVGASLFLVAGVGLRNSITNGVRFTTSLPGISKKHTIEGKLVIAEAKFSS